MADRKSTEGKPVIEPDFYKDFHCIAGDCSFTCCKEWKIRVDSESKKRWEKLPGHVTDSITSQDGQDVIGLLPNMRCPFLDEHALCRLVLQYGEACLSETCHVFPRETHTFPDRTERTLVSCCPEIVDRLYKLDRLRFTGLPYTDRAFLLKGEDRLFQIRNILLYWLSDRQLSNEANLKRCFFMLLDLFEKETKLRQKEKIRAGKKTHSLQETEALHMLDPGECLKDADVEELTKRILSMPKDAAASLEEQNDLFLDITENYRKEGRYQTLLEPLYEEAVKLDAAFKAEGSGESEQLRCALELQEKLRRCYASLLRNDLVAEAFATLLIPGCTLRDMVLQFEWMIMEYVLILHAMVLEALALEKTESPADGMPEEPAERIGKASVDTVLPYPKARSVLILMARMTGYDGDEIEDYLKDSFEDPIWPWGYADYLLG